MMLEEAILYIGLTQCLFAAFALGTKNLITTADRIMVACLLTIGLKFLVLIMHNEHAEFFDAEFSAGLIPLTFGPFLYLYTTYQITGRRILRSRHLLHFAPFLLSTLAYFAFFKGNLIFDDKLMFVTDELQWIRFIYFLLFFGSIFGYTIATSRKLRRFRRNIQREFSYETMRVRMPWLSFILGLFGSIFSLYLIAGTMNALGGENVIDTSYISNLGLTVLAFAISYFGMKQPVLYRRAEPEDVDELEDINSKRESKPRFSNEEAEGLRQRLEHHMSSEKPYLNPELTLSDLSAQVNLSKHELTDLLNGHIGKNFFSFVNQYRLESVLRKLEDADFDHLTIMALAYDSGFNSKSTFNSLFKQHTNLTPSEYKRKSRTDKGPDQED